MAISGDIITRGNLSATGAYLRISDLTVKKIIEGDSSGKWQITYGVACYVSADERAGDSPTTLVAPSVDRFKVVTDAEPSDPFTAAYADLKTQPTVANASDLV
tara:strand:- start:60 stop:368 length:309 start_codon:yes stop_codon:yes gene_type:complete